MIGFVNDAVAVGGRKLMAFEIESKNAFLLTLKEFELQIVRVSLVRFRLRSLFLILLSH